MRQKPTSPIRRAYHLAVDSLHLPRTEIAFVPSAAWDAFGGKSFGYPTFWNNRTGEAADSLGPKADAESADLRALLKFVGVDVD